MTRTNRIRKLRARVIAFDAASASRNTELEEAEAAGKPEPDDMSARCTAANTELDAICAEADAFGLWDEDFMGPIIVLAAWGEAFKASVRAMPKGVPFKINDGQPEVLH